MLTYFTASPPGITDSPSSGETDHTIDLSSPDETDHFYLDKTDPSSPDSSPIPNVSLIAGLVAGTVLLVAVIVTAACLFNKAQVSARMLWRGNQISTSSCLRITILN